MNNINAYLLIFIIINDLNMQNNVGLMNFGNTCFMNAGIQLIMAASVLCAQLTSNEVLMNTVLKKYVITIQDYMNVNTKIIGPKILHISYQRMNIRYSGGSQEDTHEFLTYTLDDIISNIRQLKIKEDTTHDRYISSIEKLMTYTLETKVITNDNTKPSITRYRESLLSLPMPETNLTLENCYNSFLSQIDSDKTIEYSLYDLPKYLFISVKRFCYNMNCRGKRQESIEIPFLTDMFGPTYKLKGFVLHMGSANGGHYITYASRKIDETVKWFCYNDNNVSEIDVIVAEQKSKEGYVFLYSHVA